MNLETMSRDELVSLYLKLEQKLGWYSITMLEVDHVKEQLESLDVDPMPTDQQIHRACAYVSRKHSEECHHLTEWAIDIATQHAAEVKP